MSNKIEVVDSVYDSLSTPENLRNHQIAVAAVGKTIVDNWEGPEIDRDSLIILFLFHDLGNVLRFRDDDPSIKNLQDKYREHFLDNLNTSQVHEHTSYPDELMVTSKILKMLGYENAARILEEEDELFARIGYTNEFSNSKESLKSKLSVINNADINALILLYADMRVAFDGITTLDQRIDDLESRKPDERFDKEIFMEIENMMNGHTRNDVKEINREILTNEIISIFLNMTVNTGSEFSEIVSQL